MPYESNVGRNNRKGDMFCLWVSADRREENSHGKWGVTEGTHRCGDAERGHHRPC